MSLSKSPFSLLKMHLYYFSRNMIKCNGIVGESKAQKILMQITGNYLKIYKEESKFHKSATFLFQIVLYKTFLEINWMLSHP